MVWEDVAAIALMGSSLDVCKQKSAQDGMNFFALAMWWRTGYLNYVEHHVMNAVSW